MTADQLRTAITWIENRIHCERRAGAASVSFDQPAVADLVSLGLDEDDAARLLGAPWWPEMVADILETPAFCGPGEPPDAVLRYARDVVGESVRKRFTP